MFCSQTYSQWLTWSLGHGNHSIRLVEWGKEIVPLVLSIFFERGQYHVLTRGHSIFLFPMAGEFTPLPMILLFPTLWRKQGIWRSLMALVQNLVKSYQATFHCYLNIWIVASHMINALLQDQLWILTPYICYHIHFFCVGELEICLLLSQILSLLCGPNLVNSLTHDFLRTCMEFRTWVTHQVLTTSLHCLYALMEKFSNSEFTGITWKVC